MAGAAWITVHGRTVKQRGEPADWDAIKLVPNKPPPVTSMLLMKSGRTCD